MNIGLNMTFTHLYTDKYSLNYNNKKIGIK